MISFKKRFRLINRIGGNEKFLNYLNTFFDKGYYTHNNQPDIQVPFLYDYIGRPDKTAERVHKIMKDGFHTDRNGLPGNDDAGYKSAWYVFNSIGFCPVPGQDIYLISSPFFKKAEISLENNKKFIAIANHTSEKNKYIQSARLNGKELNNTWFRHNDIINGGTLEFEMGSTYNGWGKKTIPPPSVYLPIN